MAGQYDHDHSEDHSGHDHSGHDHGGHDHSHTPTVTRDNERRVLIALTITGTFMLVEVIGGYLSNSLALLADAGHMLTDTAALALSYFAFRIGRRNPDEKRTYGYVRLEVVAAFVNALALFAIVIWILYEAWRRFASTPEILAGPMLIVAVLGLAVNLLVLWILSADSEKHVNMEGARLHVLGDLLGSVGAILAAIIIYLTGWTPIDPILSVVVAVLILNNAWKLLRRSLNILLQGAPETVTPDRLRDHILEHFPDEVQGVEHIHVWQITSERVVATLHLIPTPTAHVTDLASRVAADLSAHLSIEHVTVAIEFANGSTICTFGVHAEATG